MWSTTDVDVTAGFATFGPSQWLTQHHWIRTTIATKTTTMATRPTLLPAKLNADPYVRLLHLVISSDSALSNPLVAAHLQNSLLKPELALDDKN